MEEREAAAPGPRGGGRSRQAVPPGRSAQSSHGAPRRTSRNRKLLDLIIRDTPELRSHTRRLRTFTPVRGRTRPQVFPTSCSRYSCNKYFALPISGGAPAGFDALRPGTKAGSRPGKSCRRSAPLRWRIQSAKERWPWQFTVPVRPAPAFCSGLSDPAEQCSGTSRSRSKMVKRHVRCDRCGTATMAPLVRDPPVVGEGYPHLDLLAPVGVDERADDRGLACHLGPGPPHRPRIY